MGVGPEQNFTLIAAVKPSLAFIVDIRRGNLHLHCCTRRSSNCRPIGSTSCRGSSRGPGPRACVRVHSGRNLRGVPERGTERSVLQGKSEGRQTRSSSPNTALRCRRKTSPGIEYVYNAFFSYGPSIQYSSSDGFAGNGEPNYVDLMLATDAMGQQRGYLTSDEAFAAVKDLESRNAIVPLVGDFAGPEGHSRGGQVPEGPKRDGVGVLRVERRAVPQAIPHVAELLFEHPGAATGRKQHVHPRRPRRARRTRQHDDGRTGADRR